MMEVFMNITFDAQIKQMADVFMNIVLDGIWCGKALVGRGLLTPPNEREKNRKSCYWWFQKVREGETPRPAPSFQTK